MLGSAEPIFAIAVALSAIVSLIGTGARKQAVTEGRARASDLCELTGIMEPRALQDVFGPPTMNGLYQTTLKRVSEVRQPMGLLMSEDRLDLACIAIAVVSFVISHQLTGLFVLLSAGYQLAGWVVSNRLPKQK
ncbi:hypothetical protein [Ponticaulis sp.]|uniref:hypothetical protein n=1 Tax=Ponticaulis sp. TaxID=2020902 RepID=UPI000B740063|nr:hypothetical protein [Ponticaulis sp.]MAI90267.1 hypothetical protein [Ponticaulis sp.]OUX99909.1 MAG: hypothetical protein CBB65_07485 [Hyphomonadaceae bacterium TMED5]|tara:strand:- start:246838 stop:247239 length:402 start_codon:yes stop_codon:yes gene_type:complete